jgi:hypothetical protein
MRRAAAFGLAGALAGAAAALRHRAQRPPLAASRPSTARPMPPASVATSRAPASDAPPTRFRSVRWELVAAPADRAELTLAHAAGAHLRSSRIDVRETPSQVFVTVLVEARADTPAPDAPATRAEATIPLSRPLGGRELVPAPTDPLGGEPPA